MSQRQRSRKAFLPIVVMLATLTAYANNSDILFDMGPDSWASTISPGGQCQCPDNCHRQIQYRGILL
ncbi:MAG TPA: hypothetical protein HPP66_01450 [Planctomycetes bacterium]|nr:hypothetical protein [Planctomycetota bacterium]